QFIRVAGARAADDPWLVTGDDSERFRFEIVTSGTEAMNLQATGGEGYVDLMWTQTDFDLLAGFQFYRATTVNGTYTRLNASIIPPDQRAYRDSNVVPGQPYYYKFTVVKSDMSESAFSNVATATPLDTIAPVLQHTPITSAAPGLPLTLVADVTDNVAVQSVTLFYRALGGATYSNRAMIKTVENRYAATLEGSLLVSPGIEYYIQASDGVNLTRSGRADLPHQTVVVDRPVVTDVTPSRGPTSGNTAVTIAGSNFKAGVNVTFGGAACANVQRISSTQLTCETPPHFPATVDVVVTNPDVQSGSLLRAFTYQSDRASLGLPATGGGQGALVQVPINLANVTGLAAASLTVTFDSSILAVRSARTGSLTPGWSITANPNTPGEVRLAMASNGGSVSGSGVLALIEFEVLGAAGSSTVLQASSLALNDGAIPVDAAAGSFTVDLVYSTAGSITFWNGGGVISWFCFWRWLFRHSFLADCTG
ncbi:MAG: serine protease, partial [Chloroflexia bacterium]|nr:serine protease [Chloroflexia bacterium]